jgi:hypothetical protein
MAIIARSLAMRYFFDIRIITEDEILIHDLDGIDLNDDFAAATMARVEDVLRQMR